VLISRGNYHLTYLLCGVVLGPTIISNNSLKKKLKHFKELFFVWFVLSIMDVRFTLGMFWGLYFERTNKFCGNSHFGS